MAKQYEGRPEKDQKGQQFADQARLVVANAYAFVRGQEAQESFSALTFEDLLQQQVDVISGKPGNNRPNQIERIKKVAADLRVMAEKIKATDPKAFDLHDGDRDVNTRK
jgi:hypothetical protein